MSPEATRVNLPITLIPGKKIESKRFDLFFGFYVFLVATHQPKLHPRSTKQQFHMAVSER